MTYSNTISDDRKLRIFPSIFHFKIFFRITQHHMITSPEDDFKKLKR